MKEVHLLKRMAHALMSGRNQTHDDPYRPAWHLSPTVGLLNDPNGFIHHNGRYHLFYQWNPLACAHGAKFWGHWSSADLVHWKHEPVALVPSESYETHGCYSGSAVADNNTITLIYTGNVKYDDGSRTAFQCIARENSKGEYDKLGPILTLPEGYTGHVRDPKVWKHDDRWYMVLGAQDKTLQGKVLLYRSDDLLDWTQVAEIAGSRLGGLGDFGYMWECPDLFPLDGREILICCPQGLAPEEERYLNTFQAGYFVGDLNYQSGHYRHQGFHELDLGFEFYAPQTTESEDGRRLMFAWMSIPDENEFFEPTIAYGWLHTMTCPRELTLRGETLFQQPARELKQLRAQHYTWSGAANYAPALPIHSAEILLAVQGEFQLDVASLLVLCWDGERLTLSRRNLRTGEPEHRYWRGELNQLQILCDHSCIEIFINDGAAAMSARYFPDNNAMLSFSGPGRLALQHWLLASCVIE
ncbi:beta-fructofuranosidase|uniref:Sucrose-6-phosphate hydrolase n=1 Tax=Brenneria salicis ATCC 15712 = DSM 30166 TaxID=714314 RepID=A0A366I7J4_9GAMM|nr:sucrose-6-phosphate hydrolase [Brenneria salicis]NMN93086.1 beta-fructofuranosidase [Brenneria salicis ATCC 15712 = DSM 30166]RBP65166.1 beta-fructofuranosidase [Brenneria salicis ATCC 15712 = DSM 30166]RLM31672.1 glycosyl hydrolase family 32 [Brenneria salicis ATCC 15712 = DSM 30166]